MLWHLNLGMNDGSAIYEIKGHLSGYLNSLGFSFLIYKMMVTIEPTL